MPFRDLFTIKVTSPKHIWPNVDKVQVQLLVPVEVASTEDEGKFFTLQAGAMIGLTRIQNPFGLIDPWFVIDLNDHVGAAERCWKDLVESGQVEIVTYVK